MSENTLPKDTKIHCNNAERAVFEENNSCRIFPKLGDTLEDIINLFAENGWEVTLEAISHCYLYWRRHYKSGYYKEGDACELFSPCGCCNPLSFTASKPSNGSHTYYC